MFSTQRITSSIKGVSWMRLCFPQKPAQHHSAGNSVVGTCRYWIGVPFENTASLPALQRGSVWKPHQVERLWDSLTRGLPIGALILATFDAGHGLLRFVHLDPPGLIRSWKMTGFD